MYKNTPSDWNNYWNRCELCGVRYHQSEGGCDCTEDFEKCECGDEDWVVVNDRIVCLQCGTKAKRNSYV